MRRDNVNLARRPFANSRPVRRVSALLLTLGLVLAAVNGLLYWRFYRGQGETRARLVEIEQKIAQEQQQVAVKESMLASLDLSGQDEQVLFLNERIRQRQFGWSTLFDTLASLLPRDVRLVRLSPEKVAGRRRGARTQHNDPFRQRVPLAIEGRARSSDAIFEFLDALIASPAFERVNPVREVRNNDGTITFFLETLYLPGQATLAVIEPTLVEVPSASAPVALDAPPVPLAALLRSLRTGS